MGSVAVFLVLLLLGRVKSEYRMLIIIRGNRQKSADVRRLVFDSFKKTPVLRAENTTAEKFEFIYEIDRRTLELFEKKEREEAVKIGRSPELFVDKLYALGELDYVNVVAQNDEIA